MARDPAKQKITRKRYEMSEKGKAQRKAYEARTERKYIWLKRRESRKPYQREWARRKREVIMGDPVTRRDFIKRTRKYKRTNRDKAARKAVEFAREYGFEVTLDFEETSHLF